MSEREKVESENEAGAGPAAGLPFAFGDLLEYAPEAVVVHDMEDRVLYWNGAAGRLYGWDSGEIVGRPVTRIFYLDTAERRSVSDQLLEEGTWQGELRQIDRRGAERLVRCRQRLLRDDGGNAVAVVSFNADVTEDLKEIDREARAHHVRSSNLLAGGIAHELNNALAPILLSSALLKRKVEEGKPREMVSMIEKCANRGAKLIADLLAFERGRGGGGETVRREKLEPVLRKVTGELVQGAIEVSLDLAPDLWDVRGNMEDLTQAFGNIVRNACEAMPEGGKLKISAVNRIFDENFEALAPEAKAGAYISLVFEDTGSGVDPATLERIAEPLFTTKEPKQGHGLGLADVLAIVKGHRGFMVLDSEAGRGMTVSLFFPSEATLESVKNTAPPFPVPSEGAGKLVLVADDEFFVRDTIRKTLEERGYNVVTATDGTEALAIYASRLDEVSMVVTNIEMPYMDGVSLCRALRKLKPDVKILVSSGHTHKERLVEMKAAGASHFLTKPYTAGHLADKVQEVLAEG